MFSLHGLAVLLRENRAKIQLFSDICKFLRGNRIFFADFPFKTFPALSAKSLTIMDIFIKKAEIRG